MGTADAFGQCLRIVVLNEGSRIDLTRGDRGNWTGGAVDSGTLRGSKFGISAAAYPELDIAALDEAEAAAIYRRDYWQPCGADRLPLPVALVLFDAAVNSGVARSVQWLQGAVGAAIDGRFGPATLAAALAAVQQHGGAAVCVEMLAARTWFLAGLPAWAASGRGWSRRLAGLPYYSAMLAARGD